MTSPGHRSEAAACVTTGRKHGKRTEKLRRQGGWAPNSPVFWEYVDEGERWEDAATPRASAWSLRRPRQWSLLPRITLGCCYLEGEGVGPGPRHHAFNWTVGFIEPEAQGFMEAQLQDWPRGIQGVV